MCAFFRNLCKPLTAACALVLVLLTAPAWGAGAPSVPQTGAEGGTRHSYGPDEQGRVDKRFMTGVAGTDAYGNPIVMGEEQEVEERKRPRPGAYGTRPAPPAEKPLPDLPSGPSKWNF